MSMAYAHEVARVRRVSGLTDRDIARATGAGASTVGAWVRKTRTPTGVRAERVAELSAVVDRLAHVMAPDYIAVWLHKPIPALGDEKPIDLLARGDYRRVGAVISAMEAPIAS